MTTLLIVSPNLIRLDAELAAHLESLDCAGRVDGTPAQFEDYLELRFKRALQPSDFTRCWVNYEAGLTLKSWKGGA